MRNLHGVAMMKRTHLMLQPCRTRDNFIIMQRTQHKPCKSLGQTGVASDNSDPEIASLLLFSRAEACACSVGYVSMS